MKILWHINNCINIVKGHLTLIGTGGGGCKNKEWCVDDISHLHRYLTHKFYIDEHDYTYQDNSTNVTFTGGDNKRRRSQSNYKASGIMASSCGF